MSNSGTRAIRSIHVAILFGGASLLISGCATQHVMRATQYRLNVHLDPAKHAIAGQAVITMQSVADAPAPAGAVWVGFDLNKNLTVSNVHVDGASLVSHTTQAARQQSDDNPHPPNHQEHLLHFDRAPAKMTVTFDYYGTLEQDIAGGEKEGAIHNLSVSAHIGPEGTYLAPDGYWYPSPDFPNEKQTDPALFLADWQVEADRIDDYELVASAYERTAAPDRLIWVSPHRMTNMTLVGGPHSVWTRRVGDVQLSVHLQKKTTAADRADNVKIAERYLDETARYIQRYEALLGPFPYEQYTIVENFFSSGFAFPTIALFDSTVMHMGEGSLRHGYLDHELVHSWWGCSVDVDPRDGNWCEALTTYCTNYYGFVLDGDAEGARKKRRDESHFLSRISPKRDMPLGTYGLKNGAGRGIAYSKGAAVFHMIERRIGKDRFWQACRALADEFQGRHANWDDLRRAFEAASGEDLKPFFNQWVRTGGSPVLTLGPAEFDASAGNLLVDLQQEGDRPFMLDLPLRVWHGDGYTDVVVPVQRAHETIAIQTSTHPRSVELDPDYHVFRKLKRSEIMPTTATTKSTRLLTIVLPAESLAGPYKKVADSFGETVMSRKSGSPKVLNVVANDKLSPEKLAGGSVLVLGSAVRHPVIQALLARTVSPITWSPRAFAVGDQTFDKPGHAVLCTVHHPDAPDEGITLYTGNSTSALANAGILGFYANSLLVFETNGRTHVVLRRDFEAPQRVTVTGG